MPLSILVQDRSYYSQRYDNEIHIAETLLSFVKCPLVCSYCAVSLVNNHILFGECFANKQSLFGREGLTHALLLVPRHGVEPGLVTGLPQASSTWRTNTNTVRLYLGYQVRVENDYYQQVQTSVTQRHGVVLTTQYLGH